MSYGILTVMPLLAIASCLALVVSVFVMFSSNRFRKPKALSFMTDGSLIRTLPARTPLSQPPDDACSRAIAG